MLELNKVYCMDCLEGMKRLPDDSVDLVLTDPPYGISMTADGFGGSKNADKTDYVRVDDWDNKSPSKEMFNEMMRVSKNQIVFGGIYFTDKLPVSSCWVCWDKRCGVTPERTYADCELIWTSFNNASRMIRFVWDGFIQDKDNKIRDKRLHPTQKPVELLDRIINCSTNKGDLVLDPFCGSGTTLLSSNKLERNCVGIDENSKSISMIRSRLEQNKINYIFNKQNIPKAMFS